MLDGSLVAKRQLTGLPVPGGDGDACTIPSPEVGAFEHEMYQFIETRAPEVFRGIVEKKQLDDQLKAALDAVVSEFAKDFAARKAAAA